MVCTHAECSAPELGHRSSLEKLTGTLLDSIPVDRALSVERFNTDLEYNALAVSNAAFVPV